MLYIETAQISISHVISVRRLMYWHTIITRHRDELISQVYHAMKDKPLKDDWICLLYKDLEKIGLSINDEEDVSQLSKYDFKTFVKMKIRQLSLSELENMKKGHKKVKFIVHKNTNKPQEYLTSGLFSNSQKSILFNLRSHCENNFTDNFHNNGQDSICVHCKLGPDSQEHALTCKEIAQHFSEAEKEVIKTIIYEDIYGEAHAQLQITTIFQSIIKIKKRLRMNNQLVAYPGNNSGPSG